MISCCIITKNEEKNLIRCYNSIRNYVTELVIVDTGSEDSTLALAKSITPNVYKYKWDNNFSNARNFAKKFASNQFILSIDADEEIKDGGELLRTLQTLDSDVGGLFVDVISYSTFSNSTSNKFRSPQVRIFRNLPNIYFNGRVHEQVTQSISNLGLKIKQSKIEIIHHGYNTEKLKILDKYQRNLNLIDIELNENYSNYYLLHKANTLLYLGRMHEAEKILLDNRNEFLSSNDLVKFFNILGRIYLNKSDFLNASNYFKKSLDVNPIQKDVLLDLSTISYHLSDHKNALNFIEKLEAINDSNTSIRGEIETPIQNIIFKKAKILLLLKQYKIALDYLLNNFDIFKTDYDILYLLANAFYKNQLFGNALNILQLSFLNGLDNPKYFETKSSILNNIDSKNRVKISLCMIVKDEENQIYDCLLSALNLVQEIIIVDTGSTDNTKEIAKQFTNKVFDYIWCDDFSDARNQSIKHATGEWILYLDADERLSNINVAKLINYLDNLDPKIGAVNCLIENVVTKSNGTTETQLGYYPRLFRNYGYPIIKFEGLIHEQISNSFKKLNLDETKSDIIIKHLGYQIEFIESKNKIQRNLDLLNRSLNNDVNDAYLKFHLGQTYIQLNDFEHAKIYFKNALELSELSVPVKCSALNQLAQLEGIAGNYTEAIKLASESVRLIPNQKFGRLILIEANYLQKNYSEALIQINSFQAYSKAGKLDIEIAYDIEYDDDKIEKLKQKIMSINKG